MRLRLPQYLATLAVAFSGCVTDDRGPIALPHAQVRKIERIVGFDRTGHETSAQLRFAFARRSVPQDVRQDEQELLIVVLTNNEDAERQCRRIIDDLRTSGFEAEYARVAVAAGDGSNWLVDRISESGRDGSTWTRTHYEEHLCCEFAITRENLLAGAEPTQTVRNGKRVEAPSIAP